LTKGLDKGRVQDLRKSKDMQISPILPQGLVALTAFRSPLHYRVPRDGLAATGGKPLVAVV
jgi:hypothetical protein